ncbi:YeeE/YedE family protein [Thermoleophilia bacterium SCSIO 60948]|nr:YeeE/YedE family protein [Thermoleophilia bacterium SCSIO 60948]
MTPARLAAALLGAAFGFLISWGQFSDPDRIRDMLLLRDPYLYEMMFSAIAVSILGVRFLRRRRFRALISGGVVDPQRLRPEPRHIGGAALFGVGWAITASCPAPIAAQLSQGVLWSLFTLAGLLVGVELGLRRQGREPSRSRTWSGSSASAQSVFPTISTNKVEKL